MDNMTRNFTDIGQDGWMAGGPFALADWTAPLPSARMPGWGRVHGGHRVIRMPPDDNAQVPAPVPSEQLLSRVYTELRTLAATIMAGERKDHTLQPTALVHEAWLRIQRGGDPGLENRALFFHAAAKSMRRILIDHARSKKRLKRGGGRQRQSADLGEFAAWEDPTAILAVDEAIEHLAKEDAEVGEVVRLRFFAGLSLAETAEALGRSEPRVRREWTYARARIAQMLYPG